MTNSIQSSSQKIVRVSDQDVIKANSLAFRGSNIRMNNAPNLGMFQTKASRHPAGLLGLIALSQHPNRVALSILAHLYTRAPLRGKWVSLNSRKIYVPDLRISREEMATCTGYQLASLSRGMQTLKSMGLVRGRVTPDTLVSTSKSPRGWASWDLALCPVGAEQVRKLMISLSSMPPKSTAFTLLDQGMNMPWIQEQILRLPLWYLQILNPVLYKLLASVTVVGEPKDHPVVVATEQRINFLQESIYAEKAKKKA